jgi:7-keto-8-aminopelargonate synthetase-like enzyme
MNTGFGLSAAARAALLARLNRRRDDAPAPEAPRGFRELPGQREMALIRDAAASLALENPFFRPHEGVASAHSVIAGREVINFGSYNYLGLNGDPRVQAAAKAAIDRHGVSASASRMVSGERPLHGAHATNVTVIGHMMGPRDLIVHDAAIHNSCTEGVRLSGAKRLSFPHNDWRAAEAALGEARRGARRALMVIEGHYSMDGDIPDLPRFIEIARRHDAWLMVDEAHALGVVGTRGHGLHEHFDIDPNEVDIWMGTLSKTLSACGGYIAGNASLIEWLKHSAPGFIYSVGLAPALAAAALESLAILHAEPERVARLQANAALFLELARDAGFDTGSATAHAIIPVILGSSIAAARYAQLLFARGINVQPIVYPAVAEKAARLRFFLSSEHSEADIRTTIAALIAIRQDAKA